MLFNTYVFMFIFMPLVFSGFYLIARFNREIALLWLAFTSFFFYAWWNPSYILLLFSSICLNYGSGYLISLYNARKQKSMAKKILIFAISFDLAILCYYKYANFFIVNINQVFTTGLNFNNIILPLGISFFTFTQIAFLVDTYQGKVKESNFIHFLLFVSYFPHLLAGPLLHHEEMMSQFVKRSTFNINWHNVSLGLAVFILGLFKKVVIADTFVVSVDSLFNPEYYDVIRFFDAWVGVLAYTVQLYFDFSGYSDMAIGLSLMFNIRLPANFNSPYKSASIIEFWRCWHMTLSRFLRDYLYIPLGGSRSGQFKSLVNLLITMLLGGLWHGAGWTFIIWGCLHGAYLVINHLWRSIKLRLKINDNYQGVIFIYKMITFLAVVLAWVFFRAQNLSSALDIFSGLFLINGISVSAAFIKYFQVLADLLNIELVAEGFTKLSPVDVKLIVPKLLLSLILIFYFPNTRQIMFNYQPTLDDLTSKNINNSENKILKRLAWKPNRNQGIIYSILFFMSLSYILSDFKPEFLYFQF